MILCVNAEGRQDILYPKKDIWNTNGSSVTAVIIQLFKSSIIIVVVIISMKIIYYDVIQPFSAILEQQK